MGRFKDDDVINRASLAQDLVKTLTDEDLIRDANSMVNQALQFYLPGEVEVTVLMAFRGRNAVAVSSSIDGAERLRWALETATKKIPAMNLLIKGKEVT